VPLKASRVKMHLGGAVFDALAGPDGKLLQGKIGGVLEFRAEEEALAKTRGNAPIDMLAASSIAVAQPLGDRNRLNGLVLEITGLGDFQLPNNARQRVRAVSKGRATVELVREPQSPSPTRLAPQERERFLRATPEVQSNDEQIRKLAREITGVEQDPAKIAALLIDWISRNLRQQYGANASTATAVLRQKAGDCTEHTVLFTALARAAGVPARQLGGIVYVEAPAPVFGWHAWAEIHDGNGWVSVDPTWKQLRVDPTHVQFSFFGDDQGRNELDWLQVLGSVKVEVRKVERT
jgi:transglutaminase-like putative cysteine protease